MEKSRMLMPGLDKVLGKGRGQRLGSGRWQALRNMIVAVVLACTTLLGVPTSQAQPNVVSMVDVTVQASVSSTQAGVPFAVAITLDHKNGWHVHTNTPKIPTSWGDFPAIATTVTLQAATGKGVSIGELQWPKAKTIEVDLAGTGKPDSYEVFAGRAVIYVPVRLEQSAFQGETAKVATLRFDVTFQACDDKVCMFEETQTVEVILPLAAAAADIKPINATTFAGFDAARLDKDQRWTAAEALAAKPARVAIGDAPPQSVRTFFGIALPADGGVLTWLVFFGLAAVGGFLLNLTPCVLPVLPLKVMAIVQHAGSPKRTLYLGMWMAAGVIAFWIGAAVPVLVLSSFADPSRIFGIWWVTLGLGLLIAIMSVGLMGLFNITLPQAVYAVNPKADSAWGSFLFGIMTAVLGLPCFGFVAGSLLAAAATLPKIVTLAIFVGLGVGMALPYFVLALKPSLIKKIPRTGPASELIKQVMGLLLLAAGVFFIGAGLIALVAEKPWLGKQLHVWIAALLGLFAGLWIISRTFQISKRLAPRTIFAIVGLFVGAVGIWYANNSTTRARTNYMEKQAGLDASMSGRLLTGTWVDYSPAIIEMAKRENKVVVLDFTAEWCLNCKALKAAVLDRDPVKGRLRDDRIVLVTVDLTALSAPGWKLIKELGQTGIPLLVVYSPGSEQPWLANSYTSDQVLVAINHALALADGAAQDLASGTNEADATMPLVSTQPAGGR